MTITRQAAYLYLHSKELLALHKKVRKLSEKAEEYKKKWHKAKTKSQQDKYEKKHKNVSDELHKLLNKHNKLIDKLLHHELNFRHKLHEARKI